MTSMAPRPQTRDTNRPTTREQQIIDTKHRPQPDLFSPFEDHTASSDDVDEVK